MPRKRLENRNYIADKQVFSEFREFNFEKQTRGPRPRIFFFDKIFIKKLDAQKISIGAPCSSGFCGLFSKKMIFWDLFSISAVICPETSKLFHFQPGIPKRFFRKKSLKCRWGGSRPKFLVSRSFFIESLSGKIFEVGLLGLFSKSNVRKVIFHINAFWERMCKCR